jgi:hypothetical protein
MSLVNIAVALCVASRWMLAMQACRRARRRLALAALRDPRRLPDRARFVRRSRPISAGMSLGPAISLACAQCRQGFDAKIPVTLRAKPEPCWTTLSASARQPNRPVNSSGRSPNPAIPPPCRTDHARPTGGALRKWREFASFTKTRHQTNMCKPS